MYSQAVVTGFYIPYRLMVRIRSRNPSSSIASTSFRVIPMLVSASAVSISGPRTTVRPFPSRERIFCSLGIVDKRPAGDDHDRFKSSQINTSEIVDGDQAGNLLFTGTPEPPTRMQQGSGQ